MIDKSSAMAKNGFFRQFCDIMRASVIGKNLSCPYYTARLSNYLNFRKAQYLVVRHYFFIYYILMGVKCTLRTYIKDTAEIVEICLNIRQNLFFFFFFIIVNLEWKKRGEKVNEFGRRKDTYKRKGFLSLFFPFSKTGSNTDADEALTVLIRNSSIYRYTW